mgnify:CR=1 FL=1
MRNETLHVDDVSGARGTFDRSSGDHKLIVTRMETLFRPMTATCGTSVPHPTELYRRRSPVQRKAQLEYGFSRPQTQIRYVR